MTTLRIADNLSLPRNIITQTFAILAIKGAGKTYTMLKMGEELLKKNLPVVFIDSMGVCWGLRASASGKGPGLPILIMGGDHGDVPLEPTAGAVIARFVVKERISVVLDLSDMRKGEQKRFVDCVRNEVIDRAKKNGILNSAAHTVWLRLCIYCGDVSKDHTQVKNQPDDPDMEIGNNKMCWRCEHIKNEEPLVFEWMTRIIDWRFKVDAWTPFKPAFEQTRVDPPPTPTRRPSRASSSEERVNDRPAACYDRG